MKNKYFLYNPEGDGFETFETKKECELAANNAIQNYLDDGWDELVTNVVAGVITHRATQVDLENRPDNVNEDGEDEEGGWWATEWDHKCNYKILPIRRETTSQERIQMRANTRSQP